MRTVPCRGLCRCLADRGLAGGGLSRLALPAAALLPVAFALYEILTPKKELGDTYAHIASMGAELVRIHGVRAVIFGHTVQLLHQFLAALFVQRRNRDADQLAVTETAQSATRSGRIPKLRGQIKRTSRPRTDGIENLTSRCTAHKQHERLRCHRCL